MGRRVGVDKMGRGIKWGDKIERGVGVGKMERMDKTGRGK